MTDNWPNLDLSIVSTLYRSEACLDEFCRRVVEVARASSSAFEIILVNDGSPDSSLARALQLQKEIPELTVIDLSRNFGHHPAILAGLRDARGKKIFLIDSDLEEEPEWLSAFQERMQTEKADVVFGQQVRRKGKLGEQVTGGIFYKVFNALSELFLGGVFVIAGFKQVAVPITKGSRKTTTYSLARRLSLFVNALTSFTTRPLQIVFTIGSLVIFVAFIAFSFILYGGLRGETLVGWASVMATIWLFGGLVMMSLGVIGIYLAKVLIEVKQRPAYTIRAVYRADESSRTSSNNQAFRK